MASVWGELKRRNVVRVAVAYVIIAWLILQVVDVINEPLSLPDWFDTVVILLLAFGLPIALILSWRSTSRPVGSYVQSISIRLMRPPSNQWQPKLRSKSLLWMYKPIL